jgi:hypothetical protein
METLVTVIIIAFMLCVAIFCGLWGDNESQPTDIFESHSLIWIENRSNQSAHVKEVSLRAIDWTGLSMHIDSSNIRANSARPIHTDQKQLHELLKINSGWRKLVSKTLGWPVLITVKLNLNEKVRRIVCL